MKPVFVARKNSFINHHICKIKPRISLLLEPLHYILSGLATRKALKLHTFIVYFHHPAAAKWILVQRRSNHHHQKQSISISLLTQRFHEPVQTHRIYSCTMLLRLQIQNPDEMKSRQLAESKLDEPIKQTEQANELRACNKCCLNHEEIVNHKSWLLRLPYSMLHLTWTKKLARHARYGMVNVSG